MDRLLLKLSQQQEVLDLQKQAMKSNGSDNIHPRILDPGSSSSSLPITPATDVFPSTTPTTPRPASATLDDSPPEDGELLRVKIQLAQAQSEISKLGQKLAHTRTVNLETETGFGVPRCMTAPRESTWGTPDDALSDTSDAMSATTFSRTRGIWGNPKGSFANVTLQTPIAEPTPANWLGGRGFNPGYPHVDEGYPAMDNYRGERLTPDPDMFRASRGRRNIRCDGRFGSSQSYVNGFGGYNGPSTQFDPVGGPMPGSPMNVASGPGPMGMSMGTGLGMGMYSQYQPQHAGTPLSPHASEFTSKSSWKNEVRMYDSDLYSPLTRLQIVSPEGQTYLPPTEPLNYRRLLDRNVNCNWKYIVDKIVCNNDQQASIFLQQKLKVGTPEQKFEIVEAIVAQAYPLMVNRFGNFLVQRCFEHGTPEQVIKIAEAIRGNTLSLSMDPFGCHVVQKAFDSVPEDYKAIMVHELLLRIPETVIHRYACHVWQKLFELRWTESPPQIMQFVNEALRGMWHEVALGETGSLVVQNIFENCLEEDKVSDTGSELMRRWTNSCDYLAPLH